MRACWRRGASSQILSPLRAHKGEIRNALPLAKRIRGRSRGGLAPCRTGRGVPLGKGGLWKNSKVDLTPARGKGEMGEGTVHALTFRYRGRRRSPDKDRRGSIGVWNPPHPQPLSLVGERGAALLDELQFFHGSRGTKEGVMNRKARHGEKGAELVEMAFVVLIFLVLMMGVFEFGRAFNIYQNITNAAREGARFAVAPQRGGTTNYPTNTEVSDVISSFMRSSYLNPAVATIN